ncbi:MAG: DUF5812 family protein [Halococcoides sp.]
MAKTRYVVDHRDEETATLRNVTSGQIHTIVDPPDVSEDEALVADLTENTDGMTWSIESIDRRWTVTIGASDQPPGDRARAAAADCSVGEIARVDRSSGALHVIPVPELETKAAVRDVLDDDATLDRAVRLGTDRVEIRHEPGLIAVRYDSSRVD